MIKKCSICNKEIKVYPSTYKRRHFCSIKCKAISQIGKPTWNKGIKTGIVPKSAFKKGSISCNKGKKFPEKSGKFSKTWKGGITKHNGYVYILNRNHPYAHFNGYIKRSRLVMEKYLGRYLKPEEQVHHINRIKNDDRIENLILFKNNKAHTKFHHIQEGMKPDEIIFNGRNL